MLLRQIDKARYSRHVRITFVAIAVALSVIAIGVSSILIALFSEPGESNFGFNLAGVIVAAIVVVLLMQRLRGHPLLAEVVYVWDLKQTLNRIYRKQRTLEQQAEENDPDAMQILMFQFRGSRQLYELDDNTITLDELMPRLRRMQRKLQDAGLDSEVDEFDPRILERF